MTIKSFLDYLYYEIGKQRYNFHLQFNEQEGIKTKWKKYSEVCFDCENPKNKWFLDHVNQREILPCECVLDFEQKDQLKPTIEKLKQMKIKFYAYETGSRGYHIHLFFNQDLTIEQKKNIIRYFGADEQVVGKHLIALEHMPHWKSGKIKREVEIKNENKM
jgi:hypothetical protein